MCSWPLEAGGAGEEWLEAVGGDEDEGRDFGWGGLRPFGGCCMLKTGA